MNVLQVATFTNLGFRRHARRFDPLDVDLTGRTVVVTGASGGLGLATSHRLAAMGARVVMVARNRSRLAEAAATVDGDVAIEVADLSLMRELRSLAARLTESEPRIDVLVNNVGVLFPDRQSTSEGMELTLATNLAGQFLLTNLLLPRLLEGAPGRVVGVSSGGMYTSRIDPSDLEFTKRRYTGTAAYAQTKRGQVILGEMWSERVAPERLVFHVMHPGWAATAGVAQSLPRFNAVMRPLLRTPDQGADTIVWLASAREPGHSTGGFWFDRRPAPTHLVDSTQETVEERGQLWQELVELTGSDVPAHMG